ncbi:hypothetical protein [Nocardioides sp. NPDC004968]|uniref:hypothetical protein n=1 Tax=Nocardioides sp. NPDC004968 TaxID=3155894 RepID=UPI0033A17E54
MPHLFTRLRVLLVAFALVAGLAPIAVAAATKPAPAEAASIRIDIAAIQSATDSLRYQRNYLASHRRWKRWAPRLSSVSSQFDSIEGQLMGRARTAVATYEAAFLTRARNRSYVSAVRVLDMFISRMNAAIDNYYRGEGFSMRPFG